MVLTYMSPLGILSKDGYVASLLETPALSVIQVSLSEKVYPQRKLKTTIV